MEIWEAAQSWVLFGALAGGLAYYYYPTTKPISRSKPQEATPSAPNKRTERNSRPKQSDSLPGSSALHKETGNGSQSKSGDKKPSTKKVHVQAPSDTTYPEHDDEPDQIDMSTRQFAEQMAKARQGSSLQVSKGKDKRVKTVKQGSVVNNDIYSRSSLAGTDAEEKPFHAASPALGVTGIEDMLEPTPAVPTTLRITGNVESQKPKKPKKEEVVETKKQRQNRLKVEERKREREEEERQRKALEEKQRRNAREARGEPAKNGLNIAKAPSQNAWTEPKSTANASLTASGSAETGSLLDTFDVESTGSSNGGPGISTAATSATNGSTSRFESDHAEEAFVAKAVKESEDDSGWQTVNLPKKSKKKADESGNTGEIAQVPSVPSKVVKQTKSVQPASKGKPNGFQALKVEEPQQGAGADPDDLENWTA